MDFNGNLMVISGYYSIIYHFILINFEINILPTVLFFFSILVIIT